MNSSLILVPFLVFAIGVFGDTDEWISVYVTEGDSVTLHTGVSEIQSNDAIEWRFAGIRIARISSGKSSIEEAFVNRLQLDSQTGDLTFTNISTKDSGEYTLKIRRSSRSSDVTFNVRVVPAAAVKSVFGLERDSVTLYTGVIEIQRDKVIQWRYGQQKSPVAEINRTADIFNTCDGPDGKFRGRLQLDHQTGSLTITHTRTEDTGLYEVEIIRTSSRYTTHHTQSFSVTVRAYVESVSVMEGDSVTLNTSLTGKQTIEQTLWTFGDDGELVADLTYKAWCKCKLTNLGTVCGLVEVKGLNGPANKKWSNTDLNPETGDLNIRNIQTDQTGLYKVEIKTGRMNLNRKYGITVTAVPDPGWSSAAVAWIGVGVGGVCFLLGAAAGVIYYCCKRSKARH